MPDPNLPSREEIRASVERGMTEFRVGLSAVRPFFLKAGGILTAILIAWTIASIAMLRKASIDDKEAKARIEALSKEQSSLQARLSDLSKQRAALERVVYTNTVLVNILGAEYEKRQSIYRNLDDWRAALLLYQSNTRRTN